MKSCCDDVPGSKLCFQAAFEQATVGMSIVSAEGRWLHINRKLCAMLGYTRDELMTRTFQDVTYPDDLGRDLDNTRRILGGEVSAFSMEKRYVRKDGSIFWANLQVSLVRKPDHTPDYFIIHHKVKTTGFSRSALAARICHTGGVAWTIDMEVIRFIRLNTILYG